MSLPRLAASTPDPRPGAVVPLAPDQAQHLRVLRLRPGAALELLLASGAWRADLAVLDRDRAEARLVAPLREDREPPVALEVYLPLTTQLSLVDDLLPPLVELGATRLVPVAWARSAQDPRKALARMERWRRIVQGAAEQSHRGRLPELADPQPFEALLACTASQRWLAWEVPSGRPNPALAPGSVALASGPEGGVTDAEVARLFEAGWLPVGLGGSILRAVTAPVAMLGAVRFALGRGEGGALSP